MFRPRTWFRFYGRQQPPARLVSGGAVAGVQTQSTALAGVVGSMTEVVEENGLLGLSVTGGAQIAAARDGAGAVGFSGGAEASGAPDGTTASSAQVGFAGAAAAGGVPPSSTTAAAVVGFSGGAEASGAPDGTTASGALAGFTGAMTMQGGGLSTSSGAIFGAAGSSAVTPPATITSAGALAGFAGGSQVTPPVATTSAGALAGWVAACSISMPAGLSTQSASRFGVLGAALVAAASGGVALPDIGNGARPLPAAARLRVDHGYRVKVVNPPSAGAVTLAEAKHHLRVQHTADDVLIERIIRAATAKCEEATRRALITQTLELTLDAFPAEGSEPLPIHLPRAPLVSVASVTYQDEAGAWQLVAALDLVSDTASEPGWLLPVPGKTWPLTWASVNAVRVRYIAGYGGPADVPEPLRQWVLLTIGAMYEHREEFITGTIVSRVPERFIDGLLDPYITDLWVG